MHYEIALDFQVFIPMDEQDYERMDKSHTFHKARMTTTQWIRQELEWTKKYNQICNEIEKNKYIMKWKGDVVQISNPINSKSLSV